MKFGEVLHEAGQRIPYVYFPCAGLVSLLATENGGRQAEVAVVGNEGVVGFPVFLGSDVAHHRAVVQGTGQALRISAELFRSKARPNEALTTLLLRYTDAFIVQLSQSAMCGHLHRVQKRLCRWLLMAQDRIGSDRLPFTQKFMADILAVRLASVSEAARPLQQAGLIHYNRGDLRILDRPGLERACCGCYRIIKERFDALRG
jgi:CRP-like cAMP-binding protein